MQILEREAFVYWNTAVRFRLKQRSGEAADVEADDLGCIAHHTFNPIILRDCVRMLGAEEEELCASSE